MLATILLGSLVRPVLAQELATSSSPSQATSTTESPQLTVEEPTPDTPPSGSDRATYYIDKYYEKEANGVARNHYFLGNIDLAEEPLSGPNSGIYYKLPDHLGSSSLTTNNYGNTIERTEYYPYGKVSSSGVTQDIGNKYKYTGKELDSETNLSYYGARYYNQDIGKFMSVDPYVSLLDEIVKKLKDPQSLNGYAYALSNPVRYIDPLGLYNIETGVIEKGDTKDSITQLINKTFNINTVWNTIAEVSFYQDRLGGKPLDELVGESLWIGTNITTDVTEKLNQLNVDRAKSATFNPSALLRFNSDWDLKSSNDETFGKVDGYRKYLSYIYDGNLIRYDAPGNINYGYVSRSFGLRDWQVQFIAAGEQTVSDIIHNQGFSLLDNAGDSRYVQMGIDSFKVGRSWWRKITNW